MADVELDRLLISVKEMAHVLDVSTTTAYDLLNKGEIEDTYIGASRKAVYQSVLDYVDRLRQAH